MIHSKISDKLGLSLPPIYE